MHTLAVFCYKAAPRTIDLILNSSFILEKKLFLLDKMPVSSVSYKSTSAEHTRQFSSKPRRAGPPRLDPYQRLINRFYEPSVLLQILGQTRGGHTTNDSDDLGPEQKRRRMFLCNLSYVCDFEKGGKSCTAIGLEESQTCYKFWVASNTARSKIVDFLKDALGRLKDVASHPPQDLEAKKTAFVDFCLEFAKERIKKEVKCLHREIENIIKIEKGLCLLH